MVLAKKARVLVPPMAGRRRLRKLAQRPLEELRCADIIDFTGRIMCERYEKERRWAVCATKDVPAKEIYTKQIENVLIQLAKQDPNLGVVVLRADKKSLNNINKTGGKHGAGDAALRLYMDALERTMRAVYPFAKRTYLVRDSPSSDETFIVVAGDCRMLRKASRSFAQVQKKTIEQCMKEASNYRYSENLLIDKAGKKVQPVRLDLARFSHSLRDPSLVARAHSSGPKMIEPEDIRPGFINKMLEELGKKDVVSSLLPPSFSPRFLLRPGISPYTEKCPVSGFLFQDSVALEVKFSHISESDKWAPFALLEKTNKGVAEILSGRFGLRYINTYMGEAVADYIIHAIGFAMKDLERQLNCKVRKTESKLMYVVDGADPEMLLLKVQELASRRIGPLEEAVFVPSIRAVPSCNLHTNDLRALMALDAMGLSHPTEALTYADLMVSAAKELKPEVVTKAISNGNPEFNLQARQVFSAIYGMIHQNPAIRDAEDLIYSIRSGLMHVEKDAERNIWDFATKWGKELRNRLLEVYEGL